MSAETDAPADALPDAIPLAVAVADLFDVPMRFSVDIWNSMDRATKQQLICDIVDVGRVR
jgi:hypothetical protein